MTNKLLTLLVMVSLSLGFLTSCDDDDTYAEQKERETNSINSFLSRGCCVTELDSGDTILYVPPIKVISEETFYAQDSTTDVSKNEYVLLSSTGIYMQIIEKGSGKKLAHGETEKVLNRYIEFNIMGDSIMSSNDNLYYIASEDQMMVSNSYGVFSGAYVSGVMRTIHSTTSVPEGWLVPLTFINLGRIASASDNIAKVRVIVPHTSGTTDAQSKVYPCLYEISYRRGR